MQFDHDEDIVALRDSIRRMLDRECPIQLVAEWDAQDYIPRDLIFRFRDLGLLALTVPEEYGGMGRHIVPFVIALEELGTRWQAICALLNMNVGYGSLNISLKGSEAQKREFLPRLLEGELLFAYGLSEPGVGADLASVTTRAERSSDTIVLNGTKRWISGANVADYIMTLVRSGEPSARRRNLSFVMVPTSSPGLTITRTECMGTAGIATCDVVFDNVELPFNLVLGEEAGWNNGWSMLAGPALEIEKLTPSAIAVGIAQAAVTEAWEYSQQRSQFGKRICSYQAVRHVLADAQTKLRACKLMLYNAAEEVQRNSFSAVDTSMAKLFIAEQACEIVLSCQKGVMGAYGYAKGFQMERLARDVLATPIYGGSSAIQRNNITALLHLPKE